MESPKAYVLTKGTSGTGGTLADVMLGGGARSEEAVTMALTRSEHLPPRSAPSLGFLATVW